MSRSIACIDYRDGKILIAKRKETGDMGGRWEFPGGKIEQDESFEQAISREMREEFGCGVEVFEKLAYSTFFHKGIECSVTAFRVKLESDGKATPFALTEHTQTKWVAPWEIEGLSFVDSDLSLFPQIKKSLNLGSKTL